MSTATRTALDIISDVGLWAYPVTDLVDIEDMRQIRNTCRAGFAHDTAIITPDQQRQWWRDNAGKLIAYLYIDRRDSVVGYGLLRQTEDGRWWSSVAVLPGHGGHGYGKAITSHIARQSPTGTTHAQARKDNPQADRIHDRRDWDVIGEDERLYHYRTREGLV